MGLVFFCYMCILRPGVTRRGQALTNAESQYAPTVSGRDRMTAVKLTLYLDLFDCYLFRCSYHRRFDVISLYWKQIVIAVLVFSDQITWIKIVGLNLAMLGSIFYKVARASPSPGSNDAAGNTTAG